jgi:hypothetical protein
MKSLFLSLLLGAAAFAQPVVTKLIDIPHTSLPFGVRVENCGIYSISSFGLAGDQLLVSAFDTRNVYHIQQDRSFRKLKSTEAAAAAVGKIPCYANGQEVHLDAQNGSYRGENGAHASVLVNGRQSLTFSSTL